METQPPDEPEPKEPEEEKVLTLDQMPFSYWQIWIQRDRFCRFGEEMLKDF